MATRPPTRHRGLRVFEDDKGWRVDCRTCRAIGINPMLYIYSNPQAAFRAAEVMHPGGIDLERAVGRT